MKVRRWVRRSLYRATAMEKCLLVAVGILLAVDLVLMAGLAGIEVQCGDMTYRAGSVARPGDLVAHGRLPVGLCGRP